MITHLVTAVSAPKLLNGSICAPRQFQCDVNTATLVLHSPISLETINTISSHFLKE